MARAETLERQLRTIDAASKDDGFPTFVREIFSLSVDILADGVFVGGPFVEDIAQWLGSNPKTIRVSARDHFKSLSFYAHIMWKIWRNYFNGKRREIRYFSYGEGMASYHLAKIKTAIRCNPYFEGITDHKPMADSVLSYSWGGTGRVTVHPGGLLEFKRGIHANDVYVDDPFQDPESKLVPTKIYKINATMKTQILDMFQDECHVAGTAQTNHDFFFDDDFASRFSRRILPAIVDEKNKVALWPEWMDYDELMAKKRERGEKVFNQEYLCSPVYAENSFFEKAKLMTAVKPKNRNYSIAEWEKEMARREEAGEPTDTDKIGGWDLGKKGHPAHFCLYEKRAKKRVQIHDKWFDRQDYTEQLEYISAHVEAFGAYRLYYDNTRGEMEIIAERGELPGEFEAVTFTFKGKHAMAEAFDRAVTNGEIELLNVPRSLSQMLVVTNDLQNAATPEGHGDSFWTTALTFRDQLDEGTNIEFV